MSDVGIRAPRERMPLLTVHRALSILALAVWTLVSCSGGTSETAPKLTSAMRILSGATGADSISSTLVQPLSVELVDEASHPIAGAVLSVSGSPAGGAVVGVNGDSIFAEQMVDTTDAQGRASVRIQLGLTVGTASVIVRDASLGLADTARYSVMPGAPASLVLWPEDTAVFVGSTYPLQPIVRDRAGNTRTGEAVGYALVSGPAQVSTSGSVATNDYGRVVITVHAGNIVDTSRASVVPNAWVAAQKHDPGNGAPIEIYLMPLDGTQTSALASGIDNAFVSGQGFGWSPDGQNLAIARGDSVDLVVPGQAEHRLIGWSGPVLLGARYSRDGQWIYYARAGQGIFRVHPDASGEQHLGYGGTEWGEDWRPSPSGDGSAVVYGSNRSPCDQNSCIRVLDIASGTERILLNGSTAAWSPVSDLIAYTSGGEVGLIHPDGTGKRVLGKLNGYVTWMDWSPDGRWLLASPGLGPVILFDTMNGTELPLPPFLTFGATAWRPSSSSTRLVGNANRSTLHPSSH